MSDPFDGGFAPPPFRAAEALVGLRRQLRELRPLAEQTAGQRYTLRGREVLRLALSADGSQIDAHCADQPSTTPRWVPQTLRTAADVRRFLDELKRRMARWDDEA